MLDFINKTVYFYRVDDALLESKEIFKLANFIKFL